MIIATLISVEEVMQILDEDSDDDFEGYFDENDGCEGNLEYNNTDSMKPNCPVHLLQPLLLVPA